MTTSKQKKLLKNSFSFFFTSVQDAPWYQYFLTPALDELKTLSAGSLVLDIGTGPGKFLELIKQQLPLECVGSDISGSMLTEARKRQSLKETALIKLEKDQSMPFQNASFDLVSFCSILFLLEDPKPLLDEAVRVLRPSGKIVVLTPTGDRINRKENTLNKNLKLEFSNWTFLLWRNSTKPKALEWKRKNILADYAEKIKLKYSRRSVFLNLAAIEILELENKN